MKHEVCIRISVLILMIGSLFKGSDNNSENFILKWKVGSLYLFSNKHNLLRMKFVCKLVRD